MTSQLLPIAGLKFIPMYELSNELLLKNDIVSFSALFKSLNITDHFNQVYNTLKWIYEELSKKAPLGARQDYNYLCSLIASNYHISSTDKNLGIGCWDHASYQKHLVSHLDSIYYTHHNFDPETYSFQLKSLCSMLKANRSFAYASHIWNHSKTKLPKHIKDLPRFYLLPKVHKTPIKGRPIVAAYSTFTTTVSTILSRRLNLLIRQFILLNRDPSSLFYQRIPIVCNSYQAKSEIASWISDRSEFYIKNGKTPEFIQRSFDFTSLYTELRFNIIFEAFQYIGTQARKIDAKLWCHSSWESLTLMLKFIVLNNYFWVPFWPTGSFGSSHSTFHQVIGIPMGTNAAPEIANITLLAFELASLTPQRDLLVKRYIDDLHLIGTELLINDFIKCYRSDVSKLSLVAADNHVFLDMNINVTSYRPQFNQKGFQVCIKVFQKPLNTYSYNRASSTSSHGIFKALIAGELTRYRRLCTHFEDFDHIRTLFKERLLLRGYSLPFIERIMSLYTWPSIKLPVIDYANNVASALQRTSLTWKHKPSVPVLRVLFYRKDAINYRFLLCYLGAMYNVPTDQVNSVIIANIRLPNIGEIIQKVRGFLFRKHPNWFSLDPHFRLLVARKAFARIVGFYSLKHAQQTTFAAQRLIKALQKEHGISLSKEFHSSFRDKDQRSIHEFFYVSPPALSVVTQTITSPVTLSSTLTTIPSIINLSSDKQINSSILSTEIQSDKRMSDDSIDDNTSAKKSWYTKKDPSQYKDPPPAHTFRKRKIDSVTGRFLPGNTLPPRKARRVEKEKARQKYDSFWKKTSFAGGAQTQTSPNQNDTDIDIHSVHSSSAVHNHPDPDSSDIDQGHNLLTNIPDLLTNILIPTNPGVNISTMDDFLGIGDIPFASSLRDESNSLFLSTSTNFSIPPLSETLTSNFSITTEPLPTRLVSKCSPKEELSNDTNSFENPPSQHSSVSPLDIGALSSNMPAPNYQGVPSPNYFSE